MEPRHYKNPLYDLILPRVEVLAGLATLLGVGLRLGYGQRSTALWLGMLTLVITLFLRALQPAYAKDGLNSDLVYGPVVPRLVLAFAGAATLVGTLFKLMLWPDAALLPVGVLGLAGLVGWQAITGRLKWRPVLTLALGLAVWLLPAGNLVGVMYRHDPTLARLELWHYTHPRDTSGYTELRRWKAATRH